MITLKEFSNRCWYLQELKIVNYGTGETIASAAAYALPPSVEGMMVHSYGVVDNTLIVEVEI